MKYLFFLQPDLLRCLAVHVVVCSVEHLKSKINLPFIQGFGSYLTQNRLCFL